MKKNNLLLPLILASIFCGSLLLAFIYQQSQINSLTSRLITPTPTPLPTAVPVATDQTSTWQTYRNDQYGFEFKYPQNLSYSEDNNGGNMGWWTISFKDNKNKNLFMLTDRGGVNMDYKTWFDRYYSDPAFNKNFTQDVKLHTIGSNTFYAFNEPGMLDGDFSYGVTDSKNKTFFIYCERDLIEKNPTFTQILSTFKFTN